jgi:hypothetical protein
VARAGRIRPRDRYGAVEPIDQSVEQQREFADEVGIGEPPDLGGFPADGLHPEPQDVAAVGVEVLDQGQGWIVLPGRRSSEF